MLVRKNTLWKRAARAYSREHAQMHIDEVIRLAKTDPEWAKHQLAVFVDYLMMCVIENYNPKYPRT